MSPHRTPRKAIPMAVLLLSVSLEVGLTGCGSTLATKDTHGTGFERGADGDREVAEGPGLFSGEQGGLVFHLPGVLRDRAIARGKERPGEAAPE